MKLFNLFKKEKLTKLDCGSMNIITGEVCEGYKNEQGEIVYKLEGKHPVWSNPEYVGTVTESQEWGYIWSSKMNRSEWIRPLYKETNLYDKNNRYFYISINGNHVYIIKEAFERVGKIISI